MSDIEYRDATAADSDVLAELFARSFTDTFGHLYRPEDLAAFLAGTGADTYREEILSGRFEIRLALAGDSPVGLTTLAEPELPVETPADTLELSQLYVLGDWQGKGIAPVLYDWVEQRARERGARHLQLSVFIDNHRARRFYEKRGFHRVGRYDFMVGSHADEDIVMRKAL